MLRARTPLSACLATHSDLMSHNPLDTSSPFEVIWLNINGINSNGSNSNFHLLLRSFLESRFSILFLQEPRLKEFKSGEMDWACNWPQSKVQGDFISNERGNGGVATIVKKKFPRNSH